MRQKLTHSQYTWSSARSRGSSVFNKESGKIWQDKNTRTNYNGNERKWNRWNKKKRTTNLFSGLCSEMRFIYKYSWNQCLQSALHICRYHIHRFNQPWTENIQKINSRKFQKNQNLNLPRWQLLEHLQCLGIISNQRLLKI